MSNQMPQGKLKKRSLEMVLLFQLDAHIWSGRKKLQPEDLKADAADLPPIALATLGAKKIINTDHLKPFEALKKRAQRICENAGVRFLSGYAIPNAKVDATAKELNEVEVEWEAEKQEFIKRYPALVEAWIEENAEWGAIIRPAITAVGYVEDAISFTWQAIRVGEAKGSGKKKEILIRGLNVQVNGLADQLFEEIAEAAQEVIDKSLHGRDRVTQKILNRVRQLRNKMHDLAFLDPRAQPVVDMMDYTLSLLPKEGHLEGINYTSLRGLMAMIADADLAMEHGQSILNGQTVADTVSKAVLGKKASSNAPSQAPTNGSTPAPQKAARTPVQVDVYA